MYLKRRSAQVRYSTEYPVRRQHLRPNFCLAILLFIKRQPLPRLQLILAGALTSSDKEPGSAPSLRSFSLADDFHQRQTADSRRAAIHARMQVGLRPHRFNLPCTPTRAGPTHSVGYSARTVPYRRPRAKSASNFAFCFVDSTLRRFAAHFFLPASKITLTLIGSLPPCACISDSSALTSIQSCPLSSTRRARKCCVALVGSNGGSVPFLQRIGAAARRNVRTSKTVGLPAACSQSA